VSPPSYANVDVKMSTKLAYGGVSIMSVVDHILRKGPDACSLNDRLEGAHLPDEKASLLRSKPSESELAWKSIPKPESMDVSAGPVSVSEHGEPGVEMWEGPSGSVRTREDSYPGMSGRQGDQRKVSTLPRIA